MALEPYILLLQISGFQYIIMHESIQQVDPLFKGGAPQLLICYTEIDLCKCVSDNSSLIQQQ
jgi:hypothetical protein